MSYCFINIDTLNIILKSHGSNYHIQVDKTSLVPMYHLMSNKLKWNNNPYIQEYDKVLSHLDKHIFLIDVIVINMNLVVKNIN